MWHKHGRNRDRTRNRQGWNWEKWAKSWEEAANRGTSAVVSAEPAPESERPRRTRRRRTRRRNEDLSPQEQAYLEAQKLASQKIKFVGHLVPYMFVVIFLLFVTKSAFVAGIVALSWGLGLASHFFHVFIAPDLRRKWTEREVGRRLVVQLSEERRALEGEQRRSLEELSASIAHEIRNPITAAKSLVQQLGEDLSSQDNVEYAKVALDELDRVERSISHLLRYAREEGMELQPVHMSDIVEGALETLGERIREQGVDIRREQDTDAEFSGDPEKLRRVLINLIGNALDAFDESDTRKPRLHVSQGENLAGTEVWIRVKDNGPGMDEETLTRIFRPFHTTKSNGTGLGLAISKKLIDQHGGKLEAHSTPGKGSEFILSLPKEHGQAREAE